MNSISGSNINNIFANNQLASAQQMFQGNVLPNNVEALPSVFRADGATVSASGGMSTTMYGVFPGGCGGDLNIGGGGMSTTMYGVFPGGGCGGDTPTIGGGMSSTMYGVFPGGGCGGDTPTIGGGMSSTMYGVFPGGGGCGGDTPTIGGGMSSTMYGVFPGGGGCGGGGAVPSNPFLNWGGSGFDFSNFDWSQFSMGAGTNVQVDMGKIQEMLKQGQEAAQKMFGSMPTFDTFPKGMSSMASMSSTTNSMVGDFQNANALLGLMAQGELNFDDLRTNFNNGEYSGMTSQLVEKLLEGKDKGYF